MYWLPFQPAEQIRFSFLLPLILQYGLYWIRASNSRCELALLRKKAKRIRFAQNLCVFAFASLRFLDLWISQYPRKKLRIYLFIKNRYFRQKILISCASSVDKNLWNKDEKFLVSVSKTFKNRLKMLIPARRNWTTLFPRWAILAKPAESSLPIPRSRITAFWNAPASLFWAAKFIFLAVRKMTKWFKISFLSWIFLFLDR